MESSHQPPPPHHHRSCHLSYRQTGFLAFAANVTPQPTHPDTYCHSPPDQLSPPLFRMGPCAGLAQVRLIRRSHLPIRLCSAASLSPHLVERSWGTPKGLTFHYSYLFYRHHQFSSSVSGCIIRWAVKSGQWIYYQRLGATAIHSSKYSQQHIHSRHVIARTGGHMPPTCGASQRLRHRQEAPKSMRDSAFRSSTATTADDSSMAALLPPTAAGSAGAGPHTFTLSTSYWMCLK